MTRLPAAIRLTLTAAIVAVPLSPAIAAKLPDERFELGLNKSQDTCSAARQWEVGSGVRRAKDQPYTITCRGLAAADAQGYVSAPGTKASVERCGSPVSQALVGIGLAEVRRCIDPRLGKVAIDVRFDRDGTSYHGAALEAAVGPLETALRIIAAEAAPPTSRRVAESSLAIDSIPPAPASTGVALVSGNSAETALADGIAALQAGRMLDASRILNDAIRAFVAADAASRVDLRLAASLANSGLSQFETATAHLAAAQALLQANPSMPDVDYKLQQLATYRGIHLINQRRWDDAIKALSRQSDASNLLDSMTLSRLNQEAIVKQDPLQPALADTKSFSRDLLDAQRQWALSVAYLALGRVDDADAALLQAAQTARNPVQAALPERIAWMKAAIERQKGRIEAQRQRFPLALASFDCAIGALKGAGETGREQCLFDGSARLPDSAINAPLLVETQLERASIASRDSANTPERVLAEYSAAVDSLPNLGGTGYVSLASLERYFGLLVKAPQTAQRDEEYLKALQSIGEPAIAREMAQLQKVKSADPAVADMLRERRDVERQLLRLRTVIAEASAGNATALPELEAERARADARLDAINEKLRNTDGIGALEDQLATIASIRSALLPGEVYLKVTALRSAMFGIAIDRNQTIIYQLDRSLPQIDALASRVLASAVSKNGRINTFDVDRANQLFDTVTGPAAAMVRSAKGVIYDPAGKLRQLPAAMLVLDQASVRAYQAQLVKSDYSKVAFLGARSELSTALSPSAFLRSRTQIRPSKASKPFLGLGQNAPPQDASDAAAERLMPFDCSVPWGAWATVAAEEVPVSAKEIAIAAEALGVGNAPQITGAEFSDANLLTGAAGKILADYQVLHFATHGSTEQTVPVDQCRMQLPPALVTTLEAPPATGPIISDGLLSFDEVAQLRLDANLVVLSACETSASASEGVAFRTGQESFDPALDGLVRAFLASGAQAVMATFWRVPANAATNNLLASFYRTGRTASISAAIKNAQTTLISDPRYSHPYYWGAYFLVGDGSKSMLSGPVRVASR